MERIKNNFKSFFRYFLLIWSTISTIIGVSLSFVTWEEIGVTKTYQKLLILLGITIFIISVSIGVVLVRKEKKVFGDINRSVSLCYGDIIKIGFPSESASKKIVVIPVNRCFDLSCEDNLVSRKTIHGQWIKQYVRSDTEKESIHQQILLSLQKNEAKYIPLSTEDKKAGYLNRYEPGTVVEINGNNNVVFYLLALSKFDKNLNAYCSEEEFYKALQGLVDYYDQNSSGEDLYCPIMGDHIVRPTRDTKDMVNLILSVFRFNKTRIHGRVHIVVYDKMKNDIPILDY